MYGWGRGNGVYQAPKGREKADQVTLWSVQAKGKQEGRQKLRLERVAGSAPKEPHEPT